MAFENSSAVAERSANGAEMIQIAELRMKQEGVSAIGAAMDMVRDMELEDADILVPLLALVVNSLTQAFEEDPFSAVAYGGLEAIPGGLAATMFDLTVQAAFGDGGHDVGALRQSAVLSLAGLLSAADAHEQAATLLAQAREGDPTPALAKAAWVARCRWAGCTTDATAFLPEAVFGYDTPEAVQTRINTEPLHLDGHRARMRIALAAADFEAALAAIATALALPMGDSDKAPLVDDLATLAGVVGAAGASAMLGADRVRWALAVAPAVTRAAASALEHRFRSGALPFLDEAEALDAAAALRTAIPEQGRTISAFPMRDGKPHVDIVWLEITNHCNQKCTFCPDMFREDARTWLPLEQVKQLIDQLADTISVGSMQLNAYGEPLLHPNIDEILAYIRERQLPWPTFFTTHGMTLVDKKLKQLSGNYPAGIAISLHNDSQESYDKTRSYKIGDYDTLVSRVAALMRQMAFERAPTHLRLYQMISNAYADARVDPMTRSAFPDSVERMRAHVRKWEAIAEQIAADAPAGTLARAQRNSDERIHAAFTDSYKGDSLQLPLLSWLDQAGHRQTAFMSARPVNTYANLLLEYDPRWSVERRLVSNRTCGFTNKPSLAIYATGKLGICCIDLHSTATFGALSDFDTLHDALTSPQALRMFAQLANGVTTSPGCQICLGDTAPHCASGKPSLPTRPEGHFRPGI
ncbi:radical SAM/SPASM domain-containing protein [Sphingomonas sp. C3-2]|uniref:radical SAM/SPASM domain-containing protein n=1 Tax=Sphingomonas sp. C3-2 TaxID=3062169 RepID=UPI00294B1DC3|nr:radical SAM protein [Sphingomonas sp. C3-2]WOK36260.1 radical SAM protein [Sphingomonas sp. C3-2]